MANVGVLVLFVLVFMCTAVISTDVEIHEVTDYTCYYYTDSIECVIYNYDGYYSDIWWLAYRAEAVLDIVVENDDDDYNTDIYINNECYRDGYRFATDGCGYYQLYMENADSSYNGLYMCVTLDYYNCITFGWIYVEIEDVSETNITECGGDVDALTYTWCETDTNGTTQCTIRSYYRHDVYGVWWLLYLDDDNELKMFDGSNIDGYNVSSTDEYSELYIYDVDSSNDGLYMCVTQDSSSSSDIYFGWANLYIEEEPETTEATEATWSTISIAIIISVSVILLLALIALVVMIIIIIRMKRQKETMCETPDIAEYASVDELAMRGDNNAYLNDVEMNVIVCEEYNRAMIQCVAITGVHSNIERWSAVISQFRAKHQQKLSDISLRKVTQDIKEKFQRVAEKRLNNELSILKRIAPNDNIVKLLGASTKQRPLFVITERPTAGDLRSFIFQQTMKDQHSVDTVYTEALMLKCLLHIAKGMQHISNMEISHCNLNTETVFVFDGNVFKIGDFDYALEVKKGPQKHPLQDQLLIRWLPPESHKNGMVSLTTDIWSYAILMWHVLTRGKQPYAETSDDTILSKQIQEGLRLPQPEPCIPQLNVLMLKCWGDESTLEVRPTFNDIVEELTTFPHITDNRDSLYENDGET